MTIDRFLELLSETPRRWGLTGIKKKIRFADATSMCPLVMVGRWRCQHISPYDHSDIMMAADNDDGHDPKLRSRLLQATGLE